MFLFNNGKKNFFASGLFFLLLCGFGGRAFPETFNPDRYTQAPPFVSTNIPPNVILSLDIGDTMADPAYRDQRADDPTPDLHDNYDPDTPYYGYFESGSRYLYDGSKGYFIATSPGSPASWDGDFLNWLCMRRMDVVRKVLTGGKVSVKTTDREIDSITLGQTLSVNRNLAKSWLRERDIDWKIGWDNMYVLEGQNGPADLPFLKSFAPSDPEGLPPSPFADGTVYLIEEGEIVPQSSSNRDVIRLGPHVEIGRVTMNWREADQNWKWVPFANSYARPRVVAEGQTFDDDGPMTDPRIKWKSGDTTGFYVRIAEWEYLDGDHPDETFSYIVVDTEPDGSPAECIDLMMDNGDLWQFCATYDTVKTNSGNCGGRSASPVMIGWGSSAPSSRPLLFTGLDSWNPGNKAVTVRSWLDSEDDTEGAHAVVQEEKEQWKGTPPECNHPGEEIVGIAVFHPEGAGAGIASGTLTYEGESSTIQAGITRGVDHDGTTVVYDTNAPFSSPPIFLPDMQTFNDPDPATVRVGGADRTNDASAVEVRIDKERSSDDGIDHGPEDVGWLAVGPSAFRIRVGTEREPTGFVQAMSPSVRLGLAVFNYNLDIDPSEIHEGNSANGGNLYPCFPDASKPTLGNYGACLSTGVHDPDEDKIRVIEEHPIIGGTTPITETLWEIKNYLQQLPPTFAPGTNRDLDRYPLYPAGIDEDDPYYYPEEKMDLGCAKTFVLHFNAGAPFWDWGRRRFPIFPGDPDGETGKDESLDDLAYYLRKEDLRNEDLGKDDLPGHQEVISYYVFAPLGEGELFSDATLKMREAAINGGFEDLDGDHAPTPDHPPNSEYTGTIDDYIEKCTIDEDKQCSCKVNEWDQDGDCEPDAFFLANDGYELVSELKRAFSSIAARNASGTAASVISNSRSGEGALYQSVFYPRLADSEGNKMTWAGQVHALLIDGFGNLREDTNGNGRLDKADDKVIVFDGDIVHKYADATEGALPSETGLASDIKYLWTSSDWLNSTDLDPVNQRSDASADHKRYIFTFVDDDKDMLAADSEVHDFTVDTLDKIGPYLHLFPPFAYGPDEPPPGVTSEGYDDFLFYQAERVVNYIRGQEQSSYTFGTSEISSTIPAMRNRQLNGSIWRLGDVVHSSPTPVAEPAENYDLLYKDSIYSEFLHRYRHRRNVVYVGANDGMFHAFNAGFYDPLEKAYLTRPLKADGSVDEAVTDHPLGAELWAYVPFNLLPHLYWLTDPDYTHVYYCDLKPKIFDAKIFENDATHPDGWGTVLVGGMRFGGGRIAADLVKDGGAYDPDADQDPTMSSALFIMDITDPEAPPKLLAEISLAGMGFTTAYPTVVVVRDKESDDFYSDGRWHLVFGSGPTDESNYPERDALTYATSRQEARLFVLDLDKLASGDRQVCLVNRSGDCIDTSKAPGHFTTLDPNSFVSDMITVDWDLDFKTDAVYFGTVSGDSSAGWGGKLRRLVIDETAPPEWKHDNTLIDLRQPVTAAPTAGIDSSGNRWLFFGTGRSFVQSDAEINDTQSYYGLKEQEGYTPIVMSQLLEVTDAEVIEGGTLTEVEGFSDYAGLRAKMADREVVSHKGWFLNFEPMERNLGQAALLGEVLTFTSYIPNSDPCRSEGSSYLYALDFSTGTAFERPVIGTLESPGEGPEKVRKKVDLGIGLAASPSLHTGREDGTKAMVQGSSGSIQVMEQKNPGIVKSGTTSWQEE